MTPNPFLGVFFHWLGGLASGSFYVPYRQVRKWAWEVYWLVGGFFSWIIVPWILALLLTNDLVRVLKQQELSTLWWTYFFGVLWGFGGLTFGLAMRYLGMSLGMGVALGYCAAFGTLLPPIFKTFLPSIPDSSVPQTITQIASTFPGQIKLLGVAICLVGIGVAAMAGSTKEREMPEKEKKKVIAEFNFRKGILVATFSGIMSACFAFAMTAGNPISDATKAAGTGNAWLGLPKLVVLLLGGFTTNFVWCVYLNIKNRTGYQYFDSEIRSELAPAANPPEASGGTTVVQTLPATRTTVERAPMLRNYFFSALAGTTWYMQFFFYQMGETNMGRASSFASWSLHMSSIIIFSTMWGWILHEWKGASKKAHVLIATGIALLVFSTLVVGCGAYLEKHVTGH